MKYFGQISAFVQLKMKWILQWRYWLLQYG